MVMEAILRKRSCGGQEDPSEEPQSPNTQVNRMVRRRRPTQPRGFAVRASVFLHFDLRFVLSELGKVLRICLTRVRLQVYR